MNEMLSHPPRWIIRSGSGIFLIVIFVILSLTWFIEYPDEITGDVLVTTTKAPIELSNQGYVQLKSLGVRENEHVESGDLIAQFDIQANPNDIEKIINYLKELEIVNNKTKLIPTYNENVQLGSFQEQWTKLTSQIDNWNIEHDLDVSRQEVLAIQREIGLREQLQTINDGRMKISVDEYELIKDELASSEKLAQQNAISKQTLVQDKRVHAQSLQNVQVQKEQRIQNLITINTLRSQLSKLQYSTRKNRLQQETELRIGVSALRNSLHNWEQNSVWVAPCSGKIIFNKILQVHRFYKSNEASVVIVPHGSTYNAVATITTEGAGKVKAGQKVFIELIDYPKNEFGILEGKVKSITQIDKEGKYEVQISLPKQLKTSYNKQIPYKAQFKGAIKIITKEKRLLSRFFERLTNVLE